MQAAELSRIGTALGRPVLDSRRLAGGFSHETCLLTLSDGLVVARLGGSDAAIEAAVMAVAAEHVPVPQVLGILHEPDERPAMVIEHVAGRPLSEVLADDGLGAADLAALGAEVGRTAAHVAAVRFARPGFFSGDELAIAAQPPWSQQLAEFAADCMDRTPQARLDDDSQRAWAELCAAHAPSLSAVDNQARLVHADLNPKNLLVTRASGAWRMAAVLDWEFSFSGCPYADAANMVRFAAPASYTEAFLAAFADHQPDDLPPPPSWLYLGRVFDMFALSDLVTRPPGHAVADQAAEQIRSWLTSGVPGLES
jgi:aminoglycoside phosphotransferase (APT) family kinase protein